MQIISLNIFDPALSGADMWNLPARVEMLVSGVDLDAPSYVDVGETFTVTHYGRLMSIFTDYPDWDEDDTERCAAQYNHLNPDADQVYPVTVMQAGMEHWRVYYVRVKRLQTWLASPQTNLKVRGWELLPDPTYVIDGWPGWYLQHRLRPCVACYAQYAEMYGAPDTEREVRKSVHTSCSLAKVEPHRMVALCQMHTAELNASRAARRTAST